METVKKIGQTEKDEEIKEIVLNVLNVAFMLHRSKTSRFSFVSNSGHTDGCGAFERPSFICW